MDRKKINILFCIDQLQIGGTEKQLGALIVRLNKLRFKTHLVCLRRPICFETIKQHSHVRILNIKKCFSLMGLIRLILFALWIKREKINVVHTFFQDATFVGVLAAKLAGIKVIISSRRDLGFWHTRQSLFVMKCINALSNKIVVNSHAIRDVVMTKEKAAKEKINVIPNGIQTNLSYTTIDLLRKELRQTLAKDDKTIIVGIVANANRYVKRLDLFIDAAYDILQSNDQCDFIIIGDGKYRHELEEKILTYKISHKVKFLGLVTDPIPYVCSFDIAVNCSDSEGFSNSVLEYMSCGRAVVATNNPGNLELIQNGKTGVLTEIGSKNALSEEIVKLANSESLRKTIGENAKAYVDKEFSVEKMVKQYETFYSKLVTQKIEL